jgi:acyl carrier protein
MSQVSVMRVDWRAWRTSHPVFAQMPFFSKTDGAASAGTELPHSVRAEVLAAAPEARVALVVESLRQHVSTVLRIAAAKIDVDQPLLAMGIDSLMAVELKSGVERELGITIPLLQLIKGPSVAELARSLVGSMTGNVVSVPEVQTQSTTDRATRKSLLQSLLSLKDNEISATPGR